MTVQYLEYTLDNLYVNHWLVAGPLMRPVMLDAATNEHKQQLAAELNDPTPGFVDAPLDWGTFNYGSETLRWKYYRAADDHLVDVSTISPVWQHARTWAAARLILPDAGSVTFGLAASGPVQVWINGKLVFQSSEFSDELVERPFDAVLEKENDVLICFEQICARRCPNQVALRIMSLPEGIGAEAVMVNLATKARYPYRHKQFEQMFAKAYLEHLTSYRGQVINLRWAEDTEEDLRYTYQMQDVNENIYVDGTWGTSKTEAFNAGHPQRIFERQMWLVLRAPGREYYEQDNRIERRLPIYVMDNEYTEQPYGDYGNRRVEALADAARCEGNLFAEIAKMALDRWDDVDVKVIEESFARVNRRDAGSAAVLAGLLIIAYRFMETTAFPKKLREPLEAALLGYRYWTDEPGQSAVDYASESQAILLHTCQILAGQRYPKRTFTNAGITGKAHLEKGEQKAREWLISCGQGGFVEWNSNSAYETDILALSTLTSLVKDETLRELSAVLLDKILFLLAINSYQGVFGSAHGASEPGMVKTGKLEATSAITRMLYGMGVYSRYIQGVVSLAIADYEFPTFFADIAAQPLEEMWSKEQHAPQDSGSVANMALYKTPDGMLSSVQDYRPGEKGSAEHIWQATLGPDAVVFANHPAIMADDDAHAPGFWLGNGVLPRVAQWKDVLVAVHRLPEDARLSFTHAFFPVYSFDEYEVSSDWAFVRKGDGYLAITAMQGMELVRRGPDGYRELRSYGQDNIWLCQIGRKAQDGDFDAFKQKVLAIHPSWENLTARFTSLRGETINFGWTGSLMVNGQEQPLAGFNHIENPYCTASLPAKQMDITYSDYLMRLNFQ